MHTLGLKCDGWLIIREERSVLRQGLLVPGRGLPYDKDGDACRVAWLGYKSRNLVSVRMLMTKRHSMTFAVQLSFRVFSKKQR